MKTNNKQTNTNNTTNKQHKNSKKNIQKNKKKTQKNKKQKKKYGHLPPKLAESQPWEHLCVDMIGPYQI